jgi:LysR family transcriptional regulator, nitrogen assimilation regulatory protein
MEIRQLECFIRVVEQGGFTRAGIALNMAQPALSRQVRALEDELGTPLLKRHGRGAEPTEAGRVFLEHAYGVLRQVAQAKEAVSQAGAPLAGQCCVGLPPSVARLLAVPVVAAMRCAAPKAKLTLSEGLSSRLVEWILAGRLDVALAFHPPRHAD